MGGRKFLKNLINGGIQINRGGSRKIFGELDFKWREKKKCMLEATAVSHTFKTSLITSLEQNTIEWAW